MHFLHTDYRILCVVVVSVVSYLCLTNQIRQQEMQYPTLLNAFLAKITLWVGMLFVVVAVTELVFDFSGTRAAQVWKIENTKSKKARRSLPKF